MTSTTIIDAVRGQQMAFDLIERAPDYKTWKPAAMAFIALYCAKNAGQERTGEDIVDAYNEGDRIRPKDDRHWGPVIRAAGEKGLLLDTDRRAPRRKGHATAGAIVYVCQRPAP